MISWNHLPVEILTIICSHLQRKEIQQCALTCYNWKPTARNLLFSKVTPSLIEHFMELFYLMRKDKELRQAKFFKNLRKIYFSPTALNYSHLYNFLQRGKLQNLARVQRPYKINESNDYMDCLDIRKPLIDSVYLSEGGTFESMYDKLDEFPKLNKLRIVFLKATPIDILEKVFCKNHLASVKKIVFTLDNPGNLQTSTNLDDIRPMLHLSSLDINGYSDFAIIDDTFMLYAMKKFSNLKKLILRSEYDDIFNNDTNHVALSTDAAVQFLKYLLKLSRCIVNTIVSAEKTAMIIKESCSTAQIDLIEFPVSQIKYENFRYRPQKRQYPMLDVDTYCWKRYITHGVIGVTCKGSRESLRPELRVIEEAGHFFNHVAVGDHLHYTYKVTSLLKHIAKIQHF